MWTHFFSSLGIFLEVILLFNLLIIVHELGHFLAARWRGLVVEKFAIWFGKPLWSKTIAGVEYRLGSIPAGGFVALPQMATMAAIEGDEEKGKKELPPISWFDKIIVAAAGPLFSLLLALFFACIVSVVGHPVSQSEQTTQVGYIFPEGPAAKAGVEVGDIITAVNGHHVTRIAGMGRMSDSVAWDVATSTTPTITLSILRNGIKKEIEVTPTAPKKEGWGRKPMRQLQILPVQIPMVAALIPNSPAQKAGLERGDLILQANGKELQSLPALAELLDQQNAKISSDQQSSQPVEPIRLIVRRRLSGQQKNIEGSRTFSLTITPQYPIGEKTPRLGILWDQQGLKTLTYPSPWEQIATSGLTIWETLHALTQPHSQVSLQQLSGPVGIMRLYYMLFASPMGWKLALWFSVVINVNLALMNLLPLPVLDGGHILLGICEGIIGRPLDHRFMEWLQNGCALILISFMLYVTFFDLLDLPIPFLHHQNSPPPATKQIEFSPSPGQ